MNLSRFRHATTLFLTVAGFLAAAGRAEATPVQFGSNYYELVLVLSPSGFADGSANTWAAASAAASANIFGGVAGHLATVTSAAENTFLTTLVPSSLTGFQGAWLGGTATGWLVGPEAGNAHTYTNWGGIEPNNNGFLYMNIGNAGPGGLGFWIDDSGIQGLPQYPQDPVIGYFIEWENPLQAVPEPGTWMLLGLGLAAAVPALRARRRRNV